MSFLLTVPGRSALLSRSGQQERDGWGRGCGSAGERALWRWGTRKGTIHAQDLSPSKVRPSVGLQSERVCTCVCFMFVTDVYCETLIIGHNYCYTHMGYLISKIVPIMKCWLFLHFFKVCCHKNCLSVSQKLPTVHVYTCARMLANQFCNSNLWCTCVHERHLEPSVNDWLPHPQN